MDEIRIGLDFGTHQTKICIQRVPDEGHGVPEYEFFKFADQKGVEQYFLPSVVQINKDDTLSYGYVDPKDEKPGMPLPKLEAVKRYDASGINEAAESLYAKYAQTDVVDQESMKALVEMLTKKVELDNAAYDERVASARAYYEDEMAEYNRKRNLFRYFKQASFAEYPWESDFDPNLLCVWYLTYVIFLLEDIFPDGFALNMGVPTDDKTFNQKRELGTRILASAIYLVEEVYGHDLRKFLNENLDNLKRNTELMDFSEDLKEEYRINIFPEAYVSLIGLTSRGKLSEGMSLNADIGGGTTDISFFIVNKGIPKIYRYWSIPRGLNYIAEQSGFNYAEGGFELKAHDDVVKKYNKKKEDLAYDLVMDLLTQLRTYTKIPKSNLRNALQNRIVVYNGGGSTYPALTTEIYHFSDVKIANSDLWTEEIIRDRSKVIKLANLLTTAFGLSVAESDNEVTLCDFDTLFAKTGSESGDGERQEIDKDVC